MRTWYGFEHAYGAQTCDSSGNDLGTVYAFLTRAARDAWVANGPAYSTQPGAREAYPAKRARSGHYINWSLATGKDD